MPSAERETFLSFCCSSIGSDNGLSGEGLIVFIVELTGGKGSNCSTVSVAKYKTIILNKEHSIYIKEGNMFALPSFMKILMLLHFKNLHVSTRLAAGVVTDVLTSAARDASISFLSKCCDLKDVPFS